MFCPGDFLRGKGMKFYCENCKSVFEPGVLKMINGVYHCSMCKKQMKRIPYWETPQQYEQRTGEEFSNEGAVWFRPKNGSADFVWGICRYITAKKCGDRDIVVADPPVPPPDGWKPEA
jgi:hypothetical protein